MNAVSTVVDMVRSKGAYFKNALYYLLASALSSVITLMLNPLMSMYMSPDDYAISGYYRSFALLILPLTNFSIITYYSRNYFKFTDEQRTKVVDTLLMTLLVFGATVVPLVGGCFIIYFKLSDVAFPIFPFFLFVLFSTYLNNFLTMLQVTYRMQRKAKNFFRVTMVTTIISSILLVILVVLCKMGATGYLMAPLIGSVLFAIYCFRKLYRRNTFDWSIFKSAISFCWPLFCASILTYFFNGVDRAMLEPLHDNQTFAFYNIAFTISACFTLFFTIISQTFEPDVYKAIADQQYGKMTKILIGMFVATALANLFVLPFIGIFTDIITAHRYVGAAPFARILIMQNVAMALSYCLSYIIIGEGKTKVSLCIRILVTAIGVVMYKVLISYFQFYGAAWGHVALYLLSAICSALYVTYLFSKRRKKVIV